MAETPTRQQGGACSVLNAGQGEQSCPQQLQPLITTLVSILERWAGMGWESKAAVREAVEGGAH